MAVSTLIRPGLRLHFWDAGEWEETKHKRSKTGQFSSTGGGSAAPEEALPAPEHGILSATVNKHIHKAALEAGYKPVEGKPLEYYKEEYGERIVARPGGYWTVHSASHGSPVTGKGGASLAAFLKGEVGPESGFKVPQVKQAAAMKEAASKEVKRMVANHRCNHIVNEKATFTTDKPDGILSPVHMHEVASIVSDFMGYVDQDGKPRSIGVKDGIKYFELDGQQMEYAGGAHLPTGAINLYHEALNAHSTAGVTAHEIMHQQFHTVHQAYKAEREKALLDTRRYSHKAEFEKDYPIYTAIDKYLKTTELAVDDGITNYSRKWWKAYHDGNANAMSTIHETLAEMARLDWEGSLPRLLWYKNSTTWKPLYEAINRFYPDAVKAVGVPTPP